MVEHATKNHTLSATASPLGLLASVCCTRSRAVRKLCSHRYVDSNLDASEPEIRVRACAVTPPGLQNQIVVRAITTNWRSSRLVVAAHVSRCSCLGEGIIPIGVTETIKATLIKYRSRHDVWKARRVWCVAPGRLAVLPSHAAQPAGLTDIHPITLNSTSWGQPCLSACCRSAVSTDNQSTFAGGPVACEQTGLVTTAILDQCCLKTRTATPFP
jgi:hypothetical protein